MSTGDLPRRFDIDLGINNGARFGGKDGMSVQWVAEDVIRRGTLVTGRRCGGAVDLLLIRDHESNQASKRL